jgi:hypothetical protein
MTASGQAKYLGESVLEPRRATLRLGDGHDNFSKRRNVALNLELSVGKHCGLNLRMLSVMCGVCHWAPPRMRDGVLKVMDDRRRIVVISNIRSDIRSSAQRRESCVGDPRT